MDIERELHAVIVRDMGEGACAVRASDMTIVYANPRFEQMFGYQPGELDGRPVALLQPPDDQRAEAPGIVQVLENATRAPCELLSIKKDATRLVCKATISSVDLAGHGSAWVAIFQDITEQKRHDEERKKDAELRASEERFRGLLEAAPDAMIIADDQGKIVLANTQAEVLFGYDRDRLIGSSIEMLVPSRFAEPHVKHRTAYVKQPRTRDMAPTLSLFARRHDGTELPVEIRLSPLHTPQGLLISAAVRDVTVAKANERAIRSSLQEKELLLKEIHHRVKNNLQVVSSLLKLQAARLVDPHMESLLVEMQDRVRSIALLHEKLYQSKDLSRVDMAAYINDLVRHLVATQSRAGSPDVEIRAERQSLSIDLAVPCGLILNELLTNALKHGFPQESAERGRIVVGLQRRDGTVDLSVTDNGVGLPSQFDPRTASTLGLHLVRTLARQLRGELLISSSGGTQCTLSFREQIS